MKASAIKEMISEQYNTPSNLIEVEFLESEYVKGEIQYTFSVVISKRPPNYDYDVIDKKLTVSVSQIDITDLEL